MLTFNRRCASKLDETETETVTETETEHEERRIILSNGFSSKYNTNVAEDSKKQECV